MSNSTRNSNLSEITLAAEELKKLLAKPNHGTDYNAECLYTGEFPQSKILNAGNSTLGYPSLEKLTKLKSEQNRAHVEDAVGRRLSGDHVPGEINRWVSNGVRFDVIMVHGCIDHFDEDKMMELNIQSLSVRPSLCFLWVPATKVAAGRKVLENWGFRRSEDIVFLVSGPQSKYLPKTAVNQVFKTTTWHCIMGLKGTLHRSSDQHLIHCNVDVDVIVESPKTVANVVPPEMYEIVENFTAMKRRLHIVPSYTPEALPFRPRDGWVTLGPSSFLDNFNESRYVQRTLVPSTAEIERLRPKTPPRH